VPFKLKLRNKTLLRTALRKIGLKKNGHHEDEIEYPVGAWEK